MSKDPLYEQYAYVTYEDIKKLNQTKENADSTLLAIRAPQGTSLEIPDPSGNHQHEVDPALKQEEDMETDEMRNQIFLKSAKEEILVYMITNDQKDIKEESPEYSPDNIDKKM